MHTKLQTHATVYRPETKRHTCLLRRLNTFAISSADEFLVIYNKNSYQEAYSFPLHHKNAAALSR